MNEKGIYQQESVLIEKNFLPLVNKRASNDILKTQKPITYINLVFCKMVVMGNKAIEKLDRNTIATVIKVKKSLYPLLFPPHLILCSRNFCVVGAG